MAKETENEYKQRRMLNALNNIFKIAEKSLFDGNKAGTLISGKPVGYDESLKDILRIVEFTLDEISHPQFRDK